MKKIVFLLCAVLSVALSVTAQEKPILVSGKATNDIVRLLRENQVPVRLFPDADRAVSQAGKKDALILLAEAYPEGRVRLSKQSLSAIRRKKLKVFIEFPDSLPGIDLGAETQKIKLERGIVSTGRIEGLDSLDLLAIHDHAFIPVKRKDPYIILGKVAGYIRADYGYSDIETYSLLFREGHFLVSTTRISDALTSRFGPVGSWKKVWEFILSELTGTKTHELSRWTAEVRPAHSADQGLAPSDLDSAVRQGTGWFYKAKLLIHPQWKELFEKRTAKNGEDVVFPGVPQNAPVGDGSLGILEGHASFIHADGSQPYRWWLRGDCQAEVAWALSASSNYLKDPSYKQTARNLLHHLYKTSNLRGGERNDPGSPSFGLIGWATTDPDAYYGDDNARAILATIGASVNLETSDWDNYILEAILGNFRTTGKSGFRGPWFRDAAMQKTTWKKLAARDIVNVHPHYESWLWACNLWLYDKTGYDPLLSQTRKAIAITMEKRQEWKWTNGIQQEYARMILPLAWLVRIEDTPQHREWLDFVVQKLLEDMDKSGAIREELGPKGFGRYDRIASNAEYGTKEAPLISRNGDPVADMLYTCNFAFFALNEAASATQNPTYVQAAARLSDFMVRIQIRSAAHPDLNGAWVRAFDFKQWDYWASNADSGWGPWGTLTGWTQSWILNSLMLNRQQLSFWDQSREVYKNERFRSGALEKIRVMLEDAGANNQ